MRATKSRPGRPEGSSLQDPGHDRPGDTCSGRWTCPDPQTADLFPPSAVRTPQLGKLRPRDPAQSRGSGSDVRPSTTLLPSGPGCRLPPGSRTRRPPSRCCGPGRPRRGACAAPSSSSTGPWQFWTAVRPPGEFRPPCGPRRRETGRGGVCGDVPPAPRPRALRARSPGRLGARAHAPESPGRRERPLAAALGSSGRVRNGAPHPGGEWFRPRHPASGWWPVAV